MSDGMTTEALGAVRETAPAPLHASSGARSVWASWSSTRNNSSLPPAWTTGRKTPTRPCRRVSRLTSPTATADLPERASVPAR